VLELERGGRHVAQSAVQAALVVPADPFDDRELELGAGAPHAVGDQLRLERVDEALGERVVVRVAGQADRREHAGVVERLRGGKAQVRVAAIAVLHELDVGARPALRERHAQRVEHQVGAHVAGELPANDPAAEDIEDEREEHRALPAAQGGEVAHPQPIGCWRAEVALDQIGAPVAVLARRGRPPRPGGLEDLVGVASSRTSRSSAFMRSRSPLVRRSLRVPPSASAWRTHTRSVSRCTPRSAATWATGRPDSNTSRTARSRSSPGYFFRAGNDQASTSSRTDHPGFEASAEPGLARLVVLDPSRWVFGRAAGHGDRADLPCEAARAAGGGGPLVRAQQRRHAVRGRSRSGRRRSGRCESSPRTRRAPAGLGAAAFRRRPASCPA
jgi:hypothetical protein